MAAPTPDQISRLGPEVKPFQRRDPLRRLSLGEMTFYRDSLFDVTNGGMPPETNIIPVAEIMKESHVGRYLWVIDRNGLKLLLEVTPNDMLARGVVCHTNITHGQSALQGGELWFGDDGKVYINNKSGRYGSATAAQDTAVLEYFISVGYDVVQLPPR